MLKLFYFTFIKISLISDTHRYLDPEFFNYTKECDMIGHADDIGNVSLLDKLENFKPFRAVFGNIDSQKIRLRTSETAFFM